MDKAEGLLTLALSPSEGGEGLELGAKNVQTPGAWAAIYPV